MKKQVITLVVTAAMIAPLSVSPVEAQESMPAHIQRTGERFSTNYDFPTFDWSGHKWAVRQTEGKLNFGGPQAEDPADGRAKWINGAQVLPNGDLKIQNDGIRGAVEINAIDSTGYGTYTFEYSGDFDNMDPHNVLGIFPYDMAELELNKLDEVHKNASGSTEIDFIEISRWGQIDRKLPHGGVTYYPDTPQLPSRYNIDQFDVPAGQQTLQTIAQWEHNYLRVITKKKDGEVLSDVTSTHRVPQDTGTQQLRINLWTTGANKGEHKKAEGDEIIFHDYSYTPDADSPAATAPSSSGSSFSSSFSSSAPAQKDVAPEAPAENMPGNDVSDANAPEAGSPDAVPGAPEAPAPVGEPEEAPETNQLDASSVAAQLLGDDSSSEVFNPDEKVKRSSEDKAAEKSKERGSSGSSEGFFQRLWGVLRGLFGF